MENKQFNFHKSYEERVEGKKEFEKNDVVKVKGLDSSSFTDREKAKYTKLKERGWEDEKIGNYFKAMREEQK